MADINRSNFYDLNRLKQIPITDVAQRLGVALERRHNGTWCKVRKESVPSTIIHTEKNTFYDFGTNTGGDVISLWAMSRSWSVRTPSASWRRCIILNL